MIQPSKLRSDATLEAPHLPSRGPH